MEQKSKSSIELENFHNQSMDELVRKLRKEIEAVQKKFDAASILVAEEGEATWWVDLPEDILVYIFNKGLNVHDLLHASMVCHSWRSASQHPLVRERIDQAHTNLLERHKRFSELSNDIFRLWCGTPEKSNENILEEKKNYWAELFLRNPHLVQFQK